MEQTNWSGLVRERDIELHLIGGPLDGYVGKCESVQAVSVWFQLHWVPDQNRFARYLFRDVWTDGGSGTPCMSAVFDRVVVHENTEDGA